MAPHIYTSPVHGYRMIQEKESGILLQNQVVDWTYIVVLSGKIVEKHVQKKTQFVSNWFLLKSPLEIPVFSK